MHSVLKNIPVFFRIPLTRNKRGIFVLYNSLFSLKTVCMNEIQDAAYWMALAHLPNWRIGRINTLIADILHSRGLALSDFFQCNEQEWQQEFQLSPKETDDISAAKSKLSQLASLTEELFKKEFELIPINSRNYSKILKNNLKLKYAPPLLYVKGDARLLQESSAAIVGSRNASDISLQFTGNIAQKCVANYQVVVNGFAKGVDKTALESTLKYNGKSIIVLPQGILKFAGGFKRYAEQILAGDVLVLSTFPPKAPWAVKFAMTRNRYIYGLAEEIYVAESDSSGGTWSGAIDGLKKGRTVYVRKPGEQEKNANALLIQKGAIPVDFEGNPLSSISVQTPDIAEPLTDDKMPEEIETKMKELLANAGKPLSAKQIKKKLELDVDTRKFSRQVKNIDWIAVVRQKNSLRFRLKTGTGCQEDLFG